MAIPLEPESGLFPETYVAPFIEAPELEAVADEVLAAYDEFEPIQTAIREAGLRIAYVWETKPFDPTRSPHDPAPTARSASRPRCGRSAGATGHPAGDRPPKRTRTRTSRKRSGP